MEKLLVILRNSGHPPRKGRLAPHPGREEGAGNKDVREFLKEALDELENDEVVRASVGGYAYERFMEIKRKEWDEYRLQVISWEVEKYLLA